jgi:iron/manganese superoxide dismutase-like protein
MDVAFGSLDACKKALSAAAVAEFGRGWTWLVTNGGKLQIEKTSNADTPVTRGITPLLTIDVWEHAYYLDYRNKRVDQSTPADGAQRARRRRQSPPLLRDKCAVPTGVLVFQFAPLPSFDVPDHQASRTRCRPSCSRLRARDSRQLGAAFHPTNMRRGDWRTSYSPYCSHR